MTPDEAVALGRKVAAICPAQKFNSDTPEAWAALLAGVDYDDALAALLVLGQTHQFIAPADIIAQVKRARAERLKGHVVPAPGRPDDHVGYRKQVRASVRRAAAPGGGDRRELEVGPHTERGRQFAEHGATYRPKDHRPEVDRRPAGVRAALAQVRAACASASERRRVEAGRAAWERPEAVAAAPLDDDAGEPAPVSVEEIQALKPKVCAGIESGAEGDE
ncbi:hypothetical protein [Nocardiopsis rhodophaea]|uniref:hypothetical protein n=1 Tax=Nocardiopsis rhodophaea TaxID=280238 RepID=UPI0031D929A9